MGTRSLKNVRRRRPDPLPDLDAVNRPRRPRARVRHAGQRIKYLVTKALVRNDCLLVEESSL